MTTALLFLRGRLNFYTKEGRRAGRAGAPSVLIAYGAANADALAACGLEGKLMHNMELTGAKPALPAERPSRSES